MSWHPWMILSLAWGASPFLVSAMAVKNGHRGSVLNGNMSTLGVSAHQPEPDCGTCDIFRRDDRALQLCCSGFCRGKCVIKTILALKLLSLQPLLKKGSQENCCRDAFD